MARGVFHEGVGQAEVSLRKISSSEERDHLTVRGGGAAACAFWRPRPSVSSATIFPLKAESSATRWQVGGPRAGRDVGRED